MIRFIEMYEISQFTYNISIIFIAVGAYTRKKRFCWDV